MNFRVGKSDGNETAAVLLEVRRNTLPYHTILSARILADMIESSKTSSLHASIARDPRRITP
jgi:hypothetical protein